MTSKMKIILEKDSWGWLAKVDWYDNLFAHWETPEIAIKELKNVIEMIEDYQKEQAQKIKLFKALLKADAVQV